MLALEASPSVFPDGTTVVSRDCSECGAIGYHPKHDTSPPSRCESCHREALIEDLAERGGVIGRADAFSRIASCGYFPVPDPMADDDRLVTAVETEHGPNGRYVRSITWITERECPECGYDRADKRRWQDFTFESGQTVTCRACGHDIEEHSSL